MGITLRGGGGGGRVWRRELGDSHGPWEGRKELEEDRKWKRER